MAIKGSSTLDYYTKTHDTMVTGPFEASNSTSRYALTESIVDSNRFDFSESLAKFSSPDVVSYQGKFFTVFTPGVSLFGVPFYAIGKLINLQQPFAYLSTTIISLLNMLLIYVIARKLKVSTFGSLLSSFIYAFATNAYVYMQSYTQHPLTVFVLLLLFLNVLQKRSLFNNFLFGLLAAVAILVDIPNAFLVFPLAIVWFGKNIHLAQLSKRLRVTLNIKALIAAVGIALPLVVFALYNQNLTGSPTKIAQFIGRNENITNVDLERPQDAAPTESYEVHLPFNTRHSLNGFFILVISNERGIFFYSPVLFFGLVGLYFACKGNYTKEFALLATAIILINLLSYSMFGDPWGGWSFGPRYLIPATAFLSLFMGVGLDRFRKNIIVLSLFLVLAIYSISVSTLGAFTTSSIPPKQEAVNLISPIPYTYQYNWNLLNTGRSGSYVYNATLQRKVNLLSFYTIGAFLSSLTVFIGTIFLFKNNKTI
jgi:hypothetical protein